MAKNWYYKHKEGIWERTVYMLEGVGTMDAIHLGKLMLISGKEVRCLQDIKNEYDYIENWHVNDKLFPKIWESEISGIPADLDAANTHRINGAKGGRSKAMKSIFDPMED